MTPPPPSPPSSPPPSSPPPSPSAALAVRHDLILPHRQFLGTAAPDPPSPASVDRQDADATGAAPPLRSSLAGGSWYSASGPGDGLLFAIGAGALAGYTTLTADFLVAGTETPIFALALYEQGADGSAIGEAQKQHGALMVFGFLNSCAARIRVPLGMVHQNRWMYAREGAWLKPCCYGRRIDLARVDRVALTLFRVGAQAVRWCMSPLRATASTPAPLTEPMLPRGPLIDQLGQSTLHQWPGKTRSTEAVVARLREEAASAQNATWPGTFSRYGGYAHGPKLEGTGFFRTHRDDAGGRWWLVDPEGHVFWSTGMDCVTPGEAAGIEHLERALVWVPDPQGEFKAAFGRRGGGGGGGEIDGGHFNFGIANCIRAFGPGGWRENWGKVALAQLRAFGFNTVGNWSDWQMAKAAGFPYVRPLRATFPNTPVVFRDFPDVFHANFARDAAGFAQQLDESLGDPAMIGYFLMNEPTWGFATEVPAAGMLYNTAACETRKALAEFLRRRHGTDRRLAEAWGAFTSYALIANGAFTHALNATAMADLTAFSTVMVERLYKGLSDACKQRDPNHLNLGARYYTVPPEWCLDGMKCFDVFSLNAYGNQIPVNHYNRIAARVGRPILAGEWHFGALDAGLAATGVGARVGTQADRAKAFRVYLEDAAACPSCVGAHYFQMHDQPALGRFDGENYNIGFVDVCHQPYAELAAAARASHERLYAVARGEERPWNEPPEYLSRLFI